MSNLELKTDGSGEVIYIRDEMVQDRTGRETSIWAVYQFGHVVSIEYTSARMIPYRVDFAEAA